MANDSGIEPLRMFARKLEPYWRGMLARGTLADAYRSARGDQQPDQGDEADGLRLPGQRLLLPQELKPRFPESRDDP